jgi:membrane protein DedA with SNARE-associated domain
MSRFFWQDGRFAWAPLLALLACAAAMVIADYVWRVSTVPGSAIAAFVALVLVLSVGAVVRDWMKRKRAV